MTSGNAGIERYADPLHSNDSASILLKMSVEDALSQLPAQHKQVVELRMEGHEVADIAIRTGRSKRSIERILQECRKKLARLLEDA
jgi:DNA-directed RNA polymerase specialized sigma24 family protein